MYSLLQKKCIPRVRCKEGEERDLKTDRCKKVVVLRRPNEVIDKTALIDQVSSEFVRGSL